MSFDGRWQVSIATPIGKQSVIFEITTQDGAVKGIAKQKDETVNFVNPVIDGQRLTWSQTVTKPLRLNLAFDVTVDGNQMTGTAKAGLFPTSTLIGERITE